MTTQNATGYGPNNGKYCRLMFHGEDSDFELWEIKFLAYLRTVKKGAVLADEVPDSEKNAEYLLN